jgi:DinB superfamily
VNIDEKFCEELLRRDLFKFLPNRGLLLFFFNLLFVSNGFKIRKEKEMKFDLEKSYQILERTPAVLQSLLSNLDNEWIMNNEGVDTFSPYDVIGHLIHGEKTDWTVRAKIILESGLSEAFAPWDRFAQFQESKGKTLQQLLDEFEAVRNENLTWLRSLNLTETDLDKKGMHPTLGEVTLRNLLATWVAHDLTHIAQITRVMAKQYKEEMGPWPEFFRILSF